MVGIEFSEPELRGDLYVPLDEGDDDEYECFDVQAWAEAYRRDLEAQAEHGRLPGVPFH